MIEQLFFTPSDLKQSVSTARRPRKGVIIGAGQVGMACAYSLMIQNILDEMVLVDVNQDKLKGEVMDLVHGLPFVEPSLVKAGDLARGDGDGADAECPFAAVTLPTVIQQIKSSSIASLSR